MSEGVDMNSPAEDVETLRDAAEFIRDHWGIAGDGTNQDPDTETAASICTRLDRALSARVAVVRPTDDATTPQNADSWWAEKCWRCGCRRDDHAQDGSCYTESDEKFVGSEAAVVRPTRLEIEETIQRERGQDLRRWTPAGVVDILVEAGYLDVTE